MYSIVLAFVIFPLISVVVLLSFFLAVISTLGNVASTSILLGTTSSSDVKSLSLPAISVISPALYVNLIEPSSPSDLTYL